MTYHVECLNVMIVAATVLVVAVCVFGCFSLALWAVSMIRHFIADNPLRQPEGEEIMAPLFPQQAPDASANGSGMSRTRFPS